jgi:homoserine kinase
MGVTREIRVQVPASSANLGPGFDALALALGLYLRCTLRPSAKGLQIAASGTDAATIPRDESNLVWQTFVKTAGSVGSAFELELTNEIPLGRGLGSSAAAILAGLSLADAWSRTGRGKERLIEIAAGVEGHPDNVAAAALGDLVVSCQAEDGRVLAVKSAFPADWRVVLVVPNFQLPTEAARAALPSHYARRDAVFNLQRVALLLAALQQACPELLGEAMRDRLHQPYRAPLIPGLAEVLKLEHPGMFGVALSGAGPSVVAFCAADAQEAVGKRMVECFGVKGIRAEAMLLQVDPNGVTVEG